MTTPSRALVMFGLAVLLSGCSRGDKHGREALSGTVRLRGEPLAHASIRFTDETGTREFDTGALITNGRFTIAREFGVPPGTYRVHISLQQWKGAKPKSDLAGDEGAGEMRELIPAPFSTDGVLVEVGAEAPNQFDFDIP